MSRGFREILISFRKGAWISHLLHKLPPTCYCLTKSNSMHRDSQPPTGNSQWEDKYMIKGWLGMKSHSIRVKWADELEKREPLHVGTYMPPPIILNWYNNWVRGPWDSLSITVGMQVLQQGLGLVVQNTQVWGPVLTETCPQEHRSTWLQSSLEFLLDSTFHQGQKKSPENEVAGWLKLGEGPSQIWEKFPWHSLEDKEVAFKICLMSW